ncbi:hypothetical protein [Pseudotenacibaculum haliotis]|uniref:WG repeat-containing protein n=1 Tax=Pseudotenacibaculum haliotis TaxID=1862138 RepID=A0ABW5LSW0_9FLAO
MNYKLYYKDLEIGTIVQEDQDFPNLFGTYKLSDKLKSGHNFINEYIKYSVEAYALMNKDEQKWLKLVQSEEEKFGELIESEDWKLIDQKGEVHKILIPNFGNHNEIVWRWG